MTAALLSSLRLRELELPNRIVVSPMCQYSAVDGCATDWHLVHLGQYAVSGAGLVIVEAMKMQNIIRAERDGVVKTVGAKSGDSVAADEVLVEFA